MLEFMKFLSKVKKKSVENYAKMLGITLGSFILLLGLSVSIDNFLPWNYVANTLRCIIAMTGSISLFLLGFIISLKVNYKDVESKTQGYLSSLSYKQRVNLSTILVVFSIILFLLLTKINTSGYTIASIFLFASWIWLIYFVKPNFNEVDNAVKGVSDERDLEKEIYLASEEIKKKKEVK